MLRSIRSLRNVLIAAATVPLLFVAPGLGSITRLIPSVEAAGQPASCADIAGAHPGSANGNYTIFVGSMPVKVYCADMTSSPATYLNLLHTGNLSNYSIRRVGSQMVDTHFTKVRLLVPGNYTINNSQVSCEAQICVDEVDFTYSQSQGSSQFGNQQPYAQASGCESPNGTANVDLRGTFLKVPTDIFISSGYYPFGSAQYGTLNQVVNLTGNGSCGDEQPSTFPLLPLQPLVGEGS